MSWKKVSVPVDRMSQKREKIVYPFFPGLPSMCSIWDMYLRFKFHPYSSSRVSKIVYRQKRNLLTHQQWATLWWQNGTGVDKFNQKHKTKTQQKTKTL